jgi:hypothetical protein
MNKIYGLIIVAATIFAASCSTDSGSGDSFGNTGGSEGKGGSMARFCIVGDILFTVDHSNLKSFDISEPENPNFLQSRTQNLDFGIETIFPVDSLLFIGSQTGMYIYKVSNRGLPQYLSVASHIYSCDPVVAQGNHAYVTLNSNNVGCGRNSNLLQIYDITDIKNPELVKEMAGLSSPLGLGIDGDRLFVCDRGLKVFDISDRTSPEWIDDLYNAIAYDVSDAYDVIPLNGLLILVASSGIYQLDYGNGALSLLSKIEVKR